MHGNRQLRTWTYIKLHEMYVMYGGHLTQKQMFTKLVAYLGHDAIILSIKGYASIVGFRDYVSKSVKVSVVHNVGEEGEDVLDLLIKPENPFS